MDECRILAQRLSAPFLSTAVHYELTLIALARKDAATLDELVPLAYDDVSEKLYPVARRSLHAHLIKLAREGRAQENGDRWSAAAR